MGHVPAGQLLPYRLDAATVSAQCAGDNSRPDHGWISQHDSWNNGAMDHFVATHSEPAFDGPDQGPLVMAYMTQADVRFRSALANAYMLCDAFYSSVLGPTMPNRLYPGRSPLDHDPSVVITDRMIAARQLSMRCLCHDMQATQRV